MEARPMKNQEFTLQTPLAERVRPTHLEEYIGQSHLVGPQGVITQYISQGIIPSIILYGPPGVGKTTLAHLIAKSLDRKFYALSAIDSSVKEVREVIDAAKKKDMFSPTLAPILFIDEIHRFNKAQQDALLAAVEAGTIVLIGATTENPSFEVISALLSRCQVYVLKPLVESELQRIVDQALEKDLFLKNKRVEIKQTQALFQLSGGDARKLLNLVDLVVLQEAGSHIVIDDEKVKKVAQQKFATYDKKGDQHYDIASALIKSIRGSDPNAAVYWLARMIEGGEDPKFIARRLLISASEDIGMANPTALVIANNCFQAVQVIGYPESDIILSQTAVYLATSPKSNASYMAIKKAKELVRQTGDLPVPLHLRNAPTQWMKKQGYGKGYAYSHAYEGNFIEQEYMPEAQTKITLYEPGENAKEQEIKKILRNLWNGKYGY